MTLRAGDFVVVAGDLLVAAIETEGAAIKPPRGWQKVPGGDTSRRGQRLQIFSSIPVPLSEPEKFGPLKYSFTASSRQALSGVLIGFGGADQAQPISAAIGAANRGKSTRVVAPSLSPGTGTAQLLFVGATDSARAWTPPAGMKSVKSSSSRTAIKLAHQLWTTADSTGKRTAKISRAAASIGALIALKVPLPTTCPTMRILNPRVGKRVRVGGQLVQPLQFAADAEGVISVVVQCTWTQPCIGAITLDVPSVVAAGDIEVAPGETSTVTLGLCGSVVECPFGDAPPSAPPGDPLGVFVTILLTAPNGQFVESEDIRDSSGWLTVP
jgi:hypothetical protein